jgi:3',5'-cyclic AMP phosphodiesterase CpdA
VIRALHFSDVHLRIPLTEVPLTDFAPRRLLGAVNLVLRRDRRFRDGARKLEALAATLDEQAVDVVLCTGDYTALGTSAELALARRAIAPFTSRRLGFVTVPGNHDVYVQSAVVEARFATAFGDLLGTDLPDLSVDGTWPQVRLLGDEVAVLALDSARPNPWPWRSSGAIPAAQWAALPRVLDDARVRDRFVVVLTHYAPYREDGRPDSRWHGLERALELASALAARPRTVWLHGHVHWCFHHARGRDRPDVFGAGSATDRGREGAWLFDLGRDGGRARRGRFDGDRWRFDDAPVTFGPAPPAA